MLYALFNTLIVLGPYNSSLNIASHAIDEIEADANRVEDLHHVSYAIFFTYDRSDVEVYGFR